MSNEGEERNREGEQRSKIRAGPEDLCRAIARVAVAQVCEGVGFEGIKKSSLEAFSDIAVRYICDLGKSAKHYAGLAGRSECNVFDVVKGLEDLSSTRGFSSASEVDCCAIDSGALKEVIDFVATAEEIPFAHPIPQFPVSKSSNGPQSYSQLGETSSAKHIPEWLPVFPDPQVEDAVLGLQQKRLVSSASAGPSGSANPAEGLVEAGASVSNNPFLAPPLLAGEKEVSQIAVPTRLVSTEGNKKHGPLVEMFTEAIDDANDREPDSMDIEKRLPLERRPVVHFRLKTGKKMLNEKVDVGLRNRGGEGRVPALNVDEKRDEKKRRAEQILKQSMMNPQETPENAM